MNVAEMWQRSGGFVGDRARVRTADRRTAMQMHKSTVK